MSDFYILVLVGALAALTGFGFIYLSSFGLWLGMTKMQLDLERQASIICIRRISTILTPVLLGVLLSGLERAEISSVDMVAVFMFLLWIATWLYFQRMPAAYLEIAQDERVTISMRRLALQAILLLCLFYYPWFVKWYPRTIFVLMGMVFIVDLVLQVALIALLLKERRGRAQ